MSNSSDAQLFGFKYGTLVAGFMGGVVSLSFIRELKRWQMVAAVAVGTVTAAYLTPAAMVYLAIPLQAESAAGFLIGLTAMNIIPGILRVSNAFRDSPFEIVFSGSIVQTAAGILKLIREELPRFRRKLP